MAASGEVRRLFFFSPDLRFEPLELYADDPHSVVVRSLLGYGEHVELPRFRCLWSATARLQRARVLLGRARQGEQPADAWEAFEAEWQWVSRSASVRKAVGRGANDAAVKEVLASITDELLPLLRLRAAILAQHRGDATAALAHVRALGQWTLPTQRCRAFVKAYGAYLQMLSSGGGSLTPVVVGNVTQILAQISSDEVARPFIALIEKDAAAHITQLAHVVQYAVPRVDLRQLLASAEIARAVAQINDLSGVAEGVGRLARARLLFPWSPNAVKRLEEASQLYTKYRDDFGEKRISMTPQVQAAMSSFLNGFVRALKAADEFEQTDDGRRLQQQWNEAIARDAARGVGWDDDPESLRRVIVVINALDEAFGDDEKPTPAHFTEAREIAQRNGIEPRDVPWDAIAEAFTANEIAFGAGLAFVFRSEAAADSRMQESVVADAPPVAAAPAPSATSVWLFSSRHWFVKAAAAAGIAMMLHVVVASAAVSMHRNHVNRQYDSFTAAARANDRAQTIRAGADLLSSLDATDPRLREIARAYRNTVFRQIVDLSARGDTAGVKELLAQYDSVTGRKVVRSSLAD